MQLSSVESKLTRDKIIQKENKLKTLVLGPGAQKIPFGYHCIPPIAF